MGPSCSPTLTTCQPKCNLTCESRAFESAPVFLFGGLVYTVGLPSLVGLYFCGKFADFAVGTGMMHWLEESFDSAGAHSPPFVAHGLAHGTERLSQVL